MSAIDLALLVLSPLAASVGLAPLDALLGGTPLAIPLLELRLEILLLPATGLPALGW
ncbi:hypothetical protein [Antarcticirhabdus aurantiaca]|uniref:Uncharacterized protein n=1 Tax=Antarcticirhabdus aurantiaca TaxID=2606717 RepID=A0ACD4NTG4_9HYPH|nr:hypothetical protein [Antarcticirhabdus aurantiaca]WAJ30092.1 hypothetical protein OXU80_07765 [Jeongeuplla avenae]